MPENNKNVYGGIMDTQTTLETSKTGTAHTQQDTNNNTIIKRRLAAAFPGFVEATDLSSIDPLVYEYYKRLLQKDFVRADEAKNPNALRDQIEVVTVDNTKQWLARHEALAEMSGFRGREVEALGWRKHIHFLDTPIEGFPAENDNSDIQGTVYFVQRFVTGEIACVVRIHPGMDKYGRDISMIGLNLSHLLYPGRNDHLAANIYETSRVILDDERLPRKLPDGSRNPDRTRASLNCLAASILYANAIGVRGLFCFMPVSVWKVAYKAMGMEVERLGPNRQMQDGPGKPVYTVYAGYMKFTPERLATLRANAQFDETKMHFGMDPRQHLQRFMDFLQEKGWQPPAPNRG